MEVISQLGEYNLGEDIDFSVKIIPDITANALVKLTLRCTNNEILYYTAPVELEQGEEISIEAPSIKAFSEGLCNIKANIESLEGEDIEGITSEEFVISDKLELSLRVDKTDVLPGDNIKIEGSASKKGEVIEDGSIMVKWDGREEQIELKGSDFNYEIILDGDIKSGEHTIVAEVSDPYGNFGEESKVIDVEAIPTTLEFNINGNEFKPMESLLLTVNLLDQADDAIEDRVSIRLFGKKGLFKDELVIFDTRTEANKKFDFAFDYSIAPGDYILIGGFGDLSEEETITILPYPKIEMKVEGYTVFIKNVGNVEYDGETTIVLDKEEKTYIINKRIKFGVGEETTIDLSREVGSGTYTVTLPEEGVEEIKTEAVNVIKNVEIEDNRPLYKKGIDKITGMFVFGTALLLSRPRSGLVIMILIILSLVGYFNREKISRFIEWIRKKREEKL
jgi:hypothetical protein